MLIDETLKQDFFFPSLMNHILTGYYYIPFQYKVSWHLDKFSYKTKVKIFSSFLIRKTRYEDEARIVHCNM